MSFRTRLREEGPPLRGVACLIPSATVTQSVAAAGADFVMVDREHGPVGRESLHAMIAATAGTTCAPLVRVPGIEESEVKLALDQGAEGIVFPLARSAADAERCVSLVRYPPDGTRGFGPFVAHSRAGVPLGSFLEQADPACCLLIETAEAVEEIEAILAVPGVDLAIVAPFDLSTALGVHGRFDAPEMADAVQRIEAAAREAGVPLGGAALDRDRSVALTAAGYRWLINGFDVLMLEGQTAAFADWR